MKHWITILVALSVIFNIAALRQCIKAERDVAGIMVHLKEARAEKALAVSAAQEKIVAWSAQVVKLQQSIGERSKAIADLQKKGDVAKANWMYWKKKFEETDTLEVCRRLADALQIDLSIKIDENSALSISLDDCLRAGIFKDQIIAEKDLAIEACNSFSAEQDMVIDKLRVELKKPRKYTVLDGLLGMLIFLGGVLIGG